jgi:hypothetical protein
MDRRRSVAPYLTNLGTNTRAAVEARIEAQAARPVEVRTIIAESEWRRW